MKNLKKLFVIIVLVQALLISSCKKKELPFTEFHNLEYGSFPRLVNPVEGVFDFDNFENPDSSFIKFEVEFYDEMQGKMVESYSWNISYGNQNSVTIATKDKTDFVINENGLPSTSFQFTLVEIFDALDLTINDIHPNKDFLMTATLKRTDGKVFTIENTDTEIVNQSTFQGFFQYKPESINLPFFSGLEGSFNAHTETNFFFPFYNCQEIWEGNIRWEAEHSASDLIGYYNIYSTDPILQEEFLDFSMGGYYACYGTTSQDNLPNGNLKIKHESNILSYAGSSQWGEIYSFTNVEVDGITLTLNWQNNYGETATVNLTRTDGKNWPTNLTCNGC